jgi:hypothetical protein
MGWVVNATAPMLYPGKETRYPLYRRLGGSQGRSGRVRKISPTPRFDPRTVQPVANRYTDWAILAHAPYSINNLIPTSGFENTTQEDVPVLLIVCVCFSYTENKVIVWIAAQCAELKWRVSEYRNLCYVKKRMHAVEPRAAGHCHWHILSTKW